MTVVIIVKTTRRTQAPAPVILFRRALASDTVVDSDWRRGQRECNFRAATPSWGREAVMHGRAGAVTNAANLALCMVNGA